MNDMSQFIHDQAANIGTIDPDVGSLAAGTSVTINGPADILNITDENGKRWKITVEEVI